MLAWMTLLLVASIARVEEPAGVETVTLRGEVVFLGEALGAFQVPEAQGPIAEQVVLKQSDGALLPLLYNVGSRAFFEDERLRGRPSELVGRQIEGLPYLQVLSARVEDESGDLRIPEYYCDVCTISVRYDQPCPCCQAPMELRYKPE